LRVLRELSAPRFSSYFPYENSSLAEPLEGHFNLITINISLLSANKIFFNAQMSEKQWKIKNRRDFVVHFYALFLRQKNT
jgi:hypothetical protein